MNFKLFLESNWRDCGYWGEAGSGVLPICKTTKRILVNKRGPGVNEGNQFGIFGCGIFLSEFGLKHPDELLNSDIPKKHALVELQEESGYHGAIELHELYVFQDNKKNRKGEPCLFRYWNYAGIVPAEFGSDPHDNHKWESAGDIWVTFEELMKLEPKHYGLKALLDNAGSKIAAFIR